MTKAQERMVEAYFRSSNRTLGEVYGNYSANKEKAYRWCESRRLELNGFDVKIPTHNQMVFTYAFRYHKEGKVWLHYETHMNTYDFAIE